MKMIKLLFCSLVLTGCLCHPSDKEFNPDGPNENLQHPFCINWGNDNGLRKGR